jgi:hypothetical protein
VCGFLFFMMDVVGAGAVGWGIDCDYSALRKEGRGKQSIASWPAVPPDSCPSIVVGGGARHMVDSHFFQFDFFVGFPVKGRTNRKVRLEVRGWSCFLFFNTEEGLFAKRDRPAPCMHLTTRRFEIVEKEAVKDDLY